MCGACRCQRWQVRDEAARARTRCISCATSNRRRIVGYALARRQPAFFSSLSIMSSTATSCFTSARAMARLARCTEVGGMPVAIEMVRTPSPRCISCATSNRRRIVSARVPGRVPGFSA